MGTWGNQCTLLFSLCGWPTAFLGAPGNIFLLFYSYLNVKNKLANDHIISVMAAFAVVYPYDNTARAPAPPCGRRTTSSSSSRQYVVVVLGGTSSE